MGPSVKGNGNVVEEKRNIRDFDEINVSRGMNVYISQGDKTEVMVRTDENLLDVVETRMEGNVLKVTSNAGIRKATALKVFVTLPEITGIKSVAGSNVFSETVLESDNLELSCSAGSNIKLELNAGDVQASASAGSNIKLSGLAREFKGKASSGANIKAEELKTSNCDVRSSSGANIWISVKNSLVAQVNSGGNVFYYGEPENTDIRKSSGGNVIVNP